MNECVVGKGQAYCYATWYNNTLFNEVAIQFKGCIYSHHDDCEKTECVETNSFRSKKVNLSCCCNMDGCNSDIRWNPDTINTEPSAQIVKKVLVETACYLMFFCAMYVAYKLYQYCFPNSNNSRPSIDPPIELNEISSTSSLGNGLSLGLVEVISRGRYGVIWKAIYNNDIVAVKIYPPQGEKSWLIEQEIYQLPSMQHDNILFFIGAEDRSNAIEAAKSEYWLITAYHECGSLCDYLKSNTLTWNQLCHITHSMARGLMHLHEEYRLEPVGQCKPIIRPRIVHRDLKSKNVLLKHDLTACISDFGVAVVLPQHGNLCGDVHTRVGLSRYMAPEVLDGSIDYSRNKTFLSVDMYACGLILWELATRCTAQLGAVPEYRLPFEEEIGQDSSFQDIIECIVNKRLRPAFKDNWKKSHSGLKELCQIIEECWTHCPEDRLTAMEFLYRCPGKQDSLNEAHWNDWSLNLPIEIDEIPSTS
ncbi:activin receptor type-2B-like [Metopolophium dirhodum]|nr:activin receptor type-2B-like [Metopolophium dirhodum]